MCNFLFILSLERTGLLQALLAETALCALLFFEAYVSHYTYNRPNVMFTRNSFIYLKGQMLKDDVSVSA